MKKTPVSKSAKRIVTILAVVLYAAGLVLMFYNTAAGLSLWLISTILGLGFLFVCRRRQELADLEEREREGRDT